MMASIAVIQGKSIARSILSGYIGISGKKLVHGVRLFATHDPDHRRVMDIVAKTL